MASERCVVLNRRPAGCTSGTLYVSELRMKDDGDSGEFEDRFDVHLPEDAQQVAFLEGHQLIRTLDNRLLYYGAPPASTRSSFSEDQLDDRCTHLVQVGNRVVIILKMTDTFRLKTFNAGAFDERFNGLESLGVTMVRYCAMSGRIVENENGERLMSLAIAGRDFGVSGVDDFSGWGILLVEVDSNNVLHNIRFRSMFVSYQSRLCLRETELLVWREGDLASMLSIDPSFDEEDDDQTRPTSEQPIDCGSSSLGDRSSNFVAEINGEIVAVFRRLAKSQSGVSRTGFVCYRLDERRRWNEICHKSDAFAYSVCVTNA